jgi:putative tryptophan/tyrosine transport system permease protein
MALYVTALQEGFLYGILALGIYLSLRVLNIPDLTAEGSFGFGAAAAAVTAAAGHPMLSLPLALLAGALAGFTSGTLQTKLRIHPVLAGIITMSGLYSVNLMVMGTTNLNIGSANSLFRVFYGLFELDPFQKKLLGAALSAAAVAAVLALAIVFFKTHLGMCLRATGDNPAMVRASSINSKSTIVIGLSLANALAALSGALIVHYTGYADINSSSGTLVYGLAAVIIGEAVFGRRGVSGALAASVAGSVIYKLIVTFVVDMNLFGKYSANLMKLMCALIVAVTLSIPAAKEYAARRRIMREAGKNA